MNKPISLSIVKLTDTSIEEQLILEEKLLRTGTENYCIINHGAPPALVLGISGKACEHINKENLPNIPVIRRYSGGGSVVVNGDTLFVSFIFNKEDLPSPICPKTLMEWNASIFQKAFDPVPVDLKENDLVIGEKKCVGNAQYFQKERVCHHSTLLYDYDTSLMSALAHPPKTPLYRGKRSHGEFLCRFKPYFPSIEVMRDKLISFLHREYKTNYKKVEDLDITKDCRIATKQLKLDQESLQNT